MRAAAAIAVWAVGLSGVAHAEPFSFEDRPRGSLGVAVGLAADLQDRASAGDTRWGLGPSLRIPARVRLVPGVAWRLDLDVEGARGVDDLTWTASTDGLTYRVQDANEHRAFVGLVLIGTGVEVSVPAKGRVRPTFGVLGGVGLVGTYHALRGSSLVLLDPAQNDVGNPSNLDPYTLQVTPWVAGDVGLVAALAPRVDLTVSAGYGSAFVAPRSLRKAPPDADARREAFAWNPVRAAVGLSFPLGGRREPSRLR